jgi:hypothetical protein
MPYSPGPAVWCYFISAALDAVDGHAARYFNQSKFLVFVSNVKVYSQCMEKIICVKAKCSKLYLLT